MLVPDGAELTVHVRGRSGLLNRFTVDDPFGPWELIHSRAVLNNAQATAILDAYVDVVKISSPSAGQLLESNQYYWIVARCSVGKFFSMCLLTPRSTSTRRNFPNVYSPMTAAGYRSARPSSSKISTTTCSPYRSTVPTTILWDGYRPRSIEAVENQAAVPFDLFNQRDFPL